MVNRAEDPEFLYSLAVQGSKSVVLIEMLDAIGKDIGMTTRWTMIQDLTRTGVMTHVRTKALEITPKGVRINQEETKKEIQADTIVLAAGSKSYNPLATLLKKKGIFCRVVGDAQKIGLAFDAVHEGFAAGKDM
jgi:2,4-dienoyl-CoA reductase (NADPH2)